MNIFKKHNKNTDKTEVAEEWAMPKQEQGEPANNQSDGDDWLKNEVEEGQLSIDVYQTEDDLVVRSTIAGVSPDEIDVAINNDMLTIRGRRELDEVIPEDDYIYKECYWGSFSRSIILPFEIKADKIEAFIENGVLTVILPKAKIKKPVSIKIKEI